VTLNDTQAIGAMHAARQHGVEVPDQLAIIGFDDAPMSQYLLPALTTVRQPIGEAGKRCVEILVRLMGEEQPELTQVLLRPKLIVRDSA
jgi:DNA-binding LacI/PurR family transcriptional regulator